MSFNDSSAPENTETVIESTNPDEPKSDPGYQSNSDAATTSLAPSTTYFIYENGRRYHSLQDSPYLFPNDALEQDREDLNHATFLKLFDGTLYFAPLPGDTALNVIDLGTGTGIWASDFADLHPSSSVLGIDLSPIQANWVPPNVKFLVDDAENEWLFPLNSFDYIHTRHMIQAFQNWPLLVSRAFQHLKPGGWIEFQEIDHFPYSQDGELAADNPIRLYWSHIHSALRSINVQFNNAPRLASIMRSAGFVNVTERIYSKPIGPWPRNKQLREVGLYWRTVLIEGLEAIALRPFTKVLGWRTEEIEAFLAEVKEAYMDPNTRAYMPFYIVYGQKPITDE